MSSFFTAGSALDGSLPDDGFSIDFTLPLGNSPSKTSMVSDQLDQTPGARFLFTLALGVILIHGLRLTQPIMLPFAVAGFLAVISLPIMFWLRQKRVPAQIAVLATVLVIASVFALLILLTSQQVTELQDRLPRYVTLFGVRVSGWFQTIEDRWPLVAQARPNFDSFINVQTALDLVGGTFQRALAFLSNTFLVFIILIFALGEATVFPKKLRAILGDREASDERLEKIVKEVQGYLGIKTVVSLGTGVLLGSWTWALGLESPVLLGLIAFILNYVPTIGSVLASVPALILAVIQYDLQHAFIVGIGYAAVNVVFGNWLEPTLMGRRLGLSTLVVILSLVFWGWLWGPVGALLSVPLTMVVKIMLENTTDLRWVAILLDKNAPTLPVQSPGEET